MSAGSGVIAHAEKGAAPNEASGSVPGAAPSILNTIADRTRERVEQDKQRISQTLMMTAAEERAQAELAQSPTGSFVFPFEAALKATDFAFICEAKKASPSKGVIAHEFNPVAIAQAYEAAGASAISCLTEPYWFLGSDAYLEQIVAAVGIPVLRKDFVVDEYQIYQAKVLGAHAVLLICAILDDAQLLAYHTLAHELGLSVLVEAHDATEVQRALAAGARIVGVNNRNLHDFSVDFSNAERLRALIPANVVYVAESGVSSAEDVARVARSGANAALIGEVLMRASDKQVLLSELRTAACEGLAERSAASLAAHEQEGGAECLR